MLKSIRWLLIVCFSGFISASAQQNIQRNYQVNSSIPYIPIEGEGTLLPLGNEEYTGALSIGFPFEFFGQRYSHFYLSANGFMSFSPLPDAGCCEGKLLPKKDNYNNLIAFAWSNNSPQAGGTINYFTEGNTGSRHLVINFNSIKHHSTGFALTVQLVLYEGSNTIEIYTKELNASTAIYTQGIENQTGDVAFFVPGRNNTTWPTPETNEAVRFTPQLYNNDAGVESIPASTEFLCSGSNKLETIIRNYGTNTINTVTVFWKYNGVAQTPVVWNTPLPSYASGDSSRATVVLGNRDFNNAETFDLKVWTAFPNGTTDTLNNNDTLSVAGRVALGGTYTIGGSNPDFASFAAAVAALKNNGVCKPVVFNIRNGIYTEQVSIPQILNTSDANTITFQAESGNTADVSLRFSANTTHNYTLQLDGADHVIVRNITILSQNTSFGRVVDIRAGASYNQFQQCVMKGAAVNSGVDNLAVVYSLQSNQPESATYNSLAYDNDNSFRDNVIEGGSFGMWFSATGAGERNLIVQNNQFVNQSYHALYLTGQKGVQIVANRINTASNQLSFRGIYTDNANDNFIIAKNTINLSAGTGIHVTNSRNGILANNAISIGGNSIAYGIQVYTSSNNVGVLHNNINITSTHATEGRCIQVVSANTIVHNNILQNAGSGYAIHVTSGTVASDYNCFFIKGNALGFFNAVYATLADWQLATGQDEHSLVTDPLFTSTNDLHVNKALLKNAGIFHTEVTDDIDGQSRDNQPDIGADEFEPTGENVELLFLHQPKPPFTAGTYPIVAGIRNSGASALTSLDISWQVNGVNQPVHHWTGSLATGSVDSVNLGNIDFNAIASYRIKAWVSNPNNTSDIELKNDTIQNPVIYVALNGTYTIGGVSPNFTTFQQAADALNTGGVLGGVTFNVRNGTYIQQVSLGSFVGNACNIPVVFQAESGDSTAVILQYTANNFNANYTLRLDGADGIQFRKMTIKALNTSNGRVVELTNGARCNQFVSCILQSVNTTATGNGLAVVFSSSGADQSDNENDNTFYNNKFIGGSYGLHFLGFVLSNAQLETNNTIADNLFENQRYRGIYLKNQTSVTLRGNKIITNSTNTTFEGVDLDFIRGKSLIEKNTISIANGGYGIHINDGAGNDSGNNIVIVNNFVSVLGNSSGYGIVTEKASRCNIQHNNVHVATSAEGYAYQITSSNLVSVINNIFANTKTGYALYLETATNFTSDYNDLYSAANVANRDGVISVTLDQWKASSGLDSHSISGNPLFKSATDLHVNKALLNNAALKINTVTDDIDGEARSATPDIGADEFVPTGENAEFVFFKRPPLPFAPGTYPVRAGIRNSGVSTLTSVDITWRVNGVVQPVFHWTGSLPTGSIDTVALGNFAFTSRTEGYQIKAWTSNPNNTSDIELQNDTLQVPLFYTGLEGAYTIGGVAPDFKTFAQAVSALNNGGVVGPVTFNARSNIYNEQLLIQSFPGNDCSRPVIFQSEAGDSTAVVLEYNSTASANYIVRLQGARGVELRKMTLKALHNTYGRAIDFQNFSVCNKVTSCVLQGLATTVAGDTRTLAYYSAIGANTISSSNAFTKNRFTGGSTGLYYKGFDPANIASETGLIVQDNYFENQRTGGMRVEFIRVPLIQRNTVMTNSTASDFIGLGLYTCHAGTRIEKNKVTLDNTGYGIFVSQCQGNNLGELQAANNVISIGGSGNAYGFYISGGTRLNFYYNSVNIRSTHATNGNSFYGNTISTVRLVNNIFANTGAGYAVNLIGITGTSYFNHNNLYSQGVNLGSWNSQNHTSLSAWQSATGRDANSISADPQFVSPTDLHVKAVALDKKAEVIATVSDDIDGQLRSTLTPDIGADEMNTASSDADIVDIIPPAKPFLAGEHPVKVVLLNNASQPLSNVDIHWSVNDSIQQVYHWTGTLVTGDTTLVNIGRFNFNLGKGYSIEAWSALPNGVPDEETSNDSARVENLFVALAGSYTIGGSAPHFTTISEAVNFLVKGSITDSVQFLIRPGTYTGQVTIPFIQGSSASKTITFRSESGNNTDVNIRFATTSANNYVIQLNGADYIRLRDLQIETTGTTTGVVLDMRNGASDNSVVNTVLKGIETSTIAANLAVINAPNSGGGNNTFIANRIERGSYGLNYSGSTNREAGTVVRGNTFSGQSQTAVQLWSHEAPVISGNTIVSGTRPVDFYGINLQGCYNATRIEANTINLHRGTGIYLSGCTATSLLRAVTVNNFVSIGGTGTAIGIDLNSSNYHDLYYNSVNVRSTHLTNGKALKISNSAQIRILNNIVSNKGGGYAIALDNVTAYESDYNDLFTTGSVLGSISTTNYSNLSAWVTATGKDIHSLSVNPAFDPDTDVHVSEATLNNVATPIAGITVDIDNEVRDATHPDIGADEFHPSVANDAGVVAITHPTMPFTPGNQPVNVVVRNHGALALTQVTIQWAINGAQQPDFSWTGTVQSGKEEMVTLGIKEFNSSQQYDIKAWTINPNGQPDTVNTNDTTHVYQLYAGVGGVYTIGGSNPDFATFNDAVTALKNGGVTGAVTFNVRNGTYREKIIIPSILGAAPDKRIVFTAESKDSTQVIVSPFSSGNNDFTMQLAGADYFTFDHLTITIEGNSFSRIIEFRAESNSNIFTSNIIRAPHQNITYTLVYAQPNSVNDHIHFINNRFVNGYYAVDYNGSDNANPAKDIVIQNNTFENQNQGAIRGTFLDAPKIRSNRIVTGTTRTDYAAIFLDRSTNDFKIEKNRINVSNGGYGISIQYTNTFFSTRGKVVNNFITVGGAGIAQGIRVYESSNHDVHFNAVNITGTHATLGRAFYSYPSTNINLLNNIFSNSGGGYAIYTENASSISVSNYNNLHTIGSVLGYWSGNRATLHDWRNASAKDAQSLSVDPVFYSDEDLHVAEILLDGAATPVAGVTDDIDGEIRNVNHPDIGADEVTFMTNDIGITQLVTPATGCELDSASSVTVKITNFGSDPKTGFVVGYIINGAESMEENVGNLVLQPGKKSEYTFTTRANLYAHGSYTIHAYTKLPGDQRIGNDTLISNIVNHHRLDSAHWDLLPADSALTLSPPVTFSWMPVQYAERYDLYIWPETSQVPVTPTVANIQKLNYTYDDELNYGVRYRWKLVAKNYCTSLSSPDQIFAIRHLPDLVVNNIQVPSSASSGQQTQVTWEVINAGAGDTQAARWVDGVYLSSDTTYHYDTDLYVGKAANFSALPAGERYTSTLTFNVPQGIAGNYYVLVRADQHTTMPESREDNNMQRSLALPITLTPHPDLQVTRIISPELVFSGQEINVTWTVKNSGMARTADTEWYDKIYFSKSEQFTGGNNGVRVKHTGELLSDSAYTVTKAIKIPDGIFGKYFIYVQADCHDKIYEHAYEANNVTRSDSVQVILTPPADYVVTEISVAPSASNRQKILVQWTVKNQGGSRPPVPNSKDALYLSTKSGNTNLTDSVYLGAFIHSGGLAPEESYRGEKVITIPEHITGTYYLYVKTDYHSQVFEYTNEHNNVTVSNAIAVVQPDLVVSSVAVTGNASGKLSSLQYTVKNTGPGILFKTKWKDKIYISQSSVFNMASAVLVDSLEHNAAFAIHDSVVMQKNVRLPEGISGTHYVHVFTDNENTVYEGSAEANNITSRALTVTLSPWADLQVVSIVHPDTVEAGLRLPATVVITNRGEAATPVTAWNDKVLISLDSVLNSNAVVVGEVLRTNALETDSSYQASLATLTLPAKLKKGYYYLYVVADADAQVYEHTNEGNNSARSRRMYVNAYPPVDLVASQLSYTGEVASGKQLSIRWTVTNNSEVVTPATWWVDAVVLSADTLADLDDLVLAEVKHEGDLSAGHPYHATAQVTLPNGISGPYYVLVVADRNTAILDVDPGNNVAATGVNVVLTKSPDLTIPVLTTPAAGITGQPVSFSFTVKNTGEGPTVKESWTDKVFLSSDNILNNHDVMLGSWVRTGKLVAGASYTVDAEVSLPPSISGNYVLLVKTDNNNVEYEHQAEQNNTKGSVITITQPLASDLIVTGITLPGEAFAGETVSLEWTLKNNSVNPAEGLMSEALYLSADTLWDINDVLIGTYSIDATISPGASLSRSVSATLPGMALGNYYVICKTDLLNNIHESNNDNNVKASGDYITVSVPELMFYQPLTATLTKAKSLYYRLEVPAALQGESLYITLEGDSLNGSNEFYIRYGDVPDRVKFDFAHDNPFQGEQEIVIPEAEAGTYYLMVYGSSRTAADQPVTLLAKVLHFEIRSVAAKKGGNTGSVTVQVNGSKLTENMKVMLTKGSTSLVAEAIQVVNSTRVYATFNLQGAALGLYNLMAVNEASDTARLENGFEVEEGRAPQLLTRVVAPPFASRWHLISVRIEFSNGGNVNIENPVVQVISAGRAPISFTELGLRNRQTELLVPLHEFKGPQGFLRPGASGSLVFFAAPGPNLSFIVVPQTNKIQ
jgi:parallel beta-helix repeat protein